VVAACLQGLLDRAGRDGRWPETMLLAVKCNRGLHRAVVVALAVTGVLRREGFQASARQPQVVWPGVDV